MSEEEIRSAATALSASVTLAGIVEWLETWRSMELSHEQYALRADQIKIGELAMELS